MSCNRNECESIMCYTHIDSIGYVCDECEIEFKEYLCRENKNPITNKDILRELKIFMKTDKDNFSDYVEEMKVDEFFSKNRI